jgi:catechol 2,3-dioxygenase
LSSSLTSFERKERKETMEKYTIASATHIGHANLKVADPERALSFYRDVLGFQVRATPRGGEMVVLGASGSSLDLALMALPGGSPPPANCTGLDHLALRYPSRRELARAYRRLNECGIALTEATDYGTNQSLYCSDPDGNGIELYWQAPLQVGQFPSQHKPLDLASLLAELDTPESPQGEATDVP